MEPLNFDKNKNLFNDNLSTGVDFTSDVSQQTIKAITGNDPISGLDLPFVLGKGKVEAAGPDKKIEFKGDASISINGGIDGMLRFGIFDTAEDILKDLRKMDGIDVSLDPLEDGVVYVIFSMEYSVNAAASGKWIFTGGSLSAGVNAEASQRMAVVRKVEKDTGIRTAFRETMGELKLPRMIKKVDDLGEDTWLVIQSEGALEGSFGAQVGYDFNWIYEGDVPGLNGSVGLQAKLGAQLGIGFNIAGQHTLMLNKEQADGKEALHLQLFKQRKNGWNFASSLAASAKADLDNFTEDNLDELVKATIGIHYSQVLDELKKIDEIRDPDKLAEVITGFGEEQLKKLTQIEEVDGFFQKAKTKLLGILDKWDTIGEEASAALWKLLDDQVDLDLDDIRIDFIRIAQGNDADIQEFIEDQLSKYDYQNKPFGKLLNAILPQEDILSTILDGDLLNKLKDKASAVANLLDTENRIKEFHDTISEEFKLDKIREAIEQNDLQALGAWMLGKLTDVLTDENGNVVLDKLKEVNAFIDKVKEKADDIIEKTKEALKKEYGVSIAYNYQKESEGAALINVLFLNDGVALPGLYLETLKGDFNNVLSKPSALIILKKGTLTHRVKRDRTLSISLPYMKRDFKHINESLAKGTFIDEEDGRLFMYELDADDVIRKSKRFSQLALDGLYQGTMNNGDEKKKKSIRLSYSFKLAKDRFKTKHLEQIVEPFIKRYLDKAFKSTDTITKESTDDWIMAMDRQIEKVENNGTKNFGSTMLNLELRVPSSIGNAWLSASDDPFEYDDVSNALQERLKDIIPMYFMENEDVFKKPGLKDELYAVLAYKSMPAISDFRIKKRDKFISHWKYEKNKNLEEVLFSEATKRKLAFSLGEIKARLKYDVDPEMVALADNFDTETINQISDILNRAFSQGDPVHNNLMSLLNVESKIIRATVNAGVQLATFLKQSEHKPQEAVKAFEEFGSIITDAFNRYTGISVITSKKDYSRYLGPELFIAAAQALDSSVKTEISGVLELLVLKKSADFKITSYLGGALPPAEDLIISQKIMDISDSITGRGGKK